MKENFTFDDFFFQKRMLQHDKTGKRKSDDDISRIIPFTLWRCPGLFIICCSIHLMSKKEISFYRTTSNMYEGPDGIQDATWSVGGVRFQ